jgi:hypothetical protein
MGDLGQYTDEWGSVWHVAEPGVAGEVKQPCLADWPALETVVPPWEMLQEADLSKVNAFCAETDRFVEAGTMVRPFERLQFLRGSENLYCDLGEGDTRIPRLLSMLHEFFMAELEMWVKTDVDAIGFMDDWGSQKALLISPALWRTMFKPLYREYCQLIKEHGKFVFFHSDGNIEAIYGDMIDVGVDAINSQLFCMDIEKLGALYSGKITFHGEIDRQHLLPFGTPAQVREAVQRVAKNMLRNGKTGVIAQCEWGIKDPMENINAVYSAWNEI